VIVSPLESPRTIGNDYVVQYQGRVLQLDRRAQSRIPVKSQVLVREARDGSLRVVFVDRTGRERRPRLDARRPTRAETYRRHHSILILIVSTVAGRVDASGRSTDSSAGSSVACPTPALETASARPQGRPGQRRRRVGRLFGVAPLRLSPDRRHSLISMHSSHLTPHTHHPRDISTGVIQGTFLLVLDKSVIAP